MTTTNVNVPLPSYPQPFDSKIVEIFDHYGPTSYVQYGSAVGDIINASQKRQHWDVILLVLMIIPLVALAVDRMLFWIQRQLFPFQYGGSGYLHRALKALLRGWEDIRCLVRRPVALAPVSPAPQPAPASAPAATEKGP